MTGERHVFLMTLVSGKEAEYQRRHDEIWPEMVAALNRCGYSDYTLHLQGSTVVGVATMTPDTKTAAALMAKEPVTARWNESFIGIIEAHADGGFGVDLPQIWRLEERGGE